MRSNFGHNGDMYEAMSEIWHSLPEKSPQRGQLEELAYKSAKLHGDWENLEEYFPESCRPLQ